MILQLRKENIKQSMSDLNAIGHRQEYVATINGVMYYDDSRAENVNATWFTFENIVTPVIWIAGGDNSMIDFKELKRITKNKVKMLIWFGKDNHRMKKTFAKEVSEFYEADNIEDAVKMASLLSKEDDIVLFSPACHSTEIGETFVERGNLFKKTVKQIENESRE